jgi:hypothetical protein
MECNCTGLDRIFRIPAFTLRLVLLLFVVAHGI